MEHREALTHSTRRQAWKNVQGEDLSCKAREKKFTGLFLIKFYSKSFFKKLKQGYTTEKERNSVETVRNRKLRRNFRRGIVQIQYLSLYCMPVLTRSKWCP